MNRIRELRKAKGLTMKELGKELGLAESTVSLYERDLHEPDLDTIRKLAAFFSVTMDYLLGHTDGDQEPKTENAPAQDSRHDKIMKELSGADIDLLEEVLNFIQFRKQHKKE